MRDRITKNPEAPEVLAEGQNLFDQEPFRSAVEKIAENNPHLSTMEGKSAIRTAVAEIGRLVEINLTTSFELHDTSQTKREEIISSEVNNMSADDFNSFVVNSCNRNPSSHYLPVLRTNSSKVIGELLREIDDKTAFMYAAGLAGGNKPYAKSGEPSKNYRQSKKRPSPTFEAWRERLNLT